MFKQVGENFPFSFLANKKIVLKFSIYGLVDGSILILIRFIHEVIGKNLAGHVSPTPPYFIRFVFFISPKLYNMWILICGF
jgi:hypothetical protein